MLLLFYSNYVRALALKLAVYDVIFSIINEDINLRDEESS